MTPQKVAYYAIGSKGKLVLQKSQIQDTVYGVPGKEVRTPHLLAIPHEGVYLAKEVALARLNMPIWGPNHDQLFVDILPVLPAKVPEFLNSPDGQYPWHTFVPNPPNNPTWPTEDPDNGRGWECEAPNAGGSGHLYYQDMSYIDASQWGAPDIFQYRKQKMSSYEHPQIPNPQFTIVETQRAEALQEYTGIIRSTFVPMGTYQFQGLPMQGAYLWKINDVEVKFRSWSHPLAFATGTWKMITSPMRNPETVHVNWRNSKTGENGVWVKNMYEDLLSGKIQLSVDQTGQDRLKKLLSIPT